MERYTVIVAPPGAESFRLLIPLPSTSSVSALAAEVERRISRLEGLPGVSDITLHLGEADGPMLDAEDALGDVIFDPKLETITATSRAMKENKVPHLPHSTPPPAGAGLSNTGEFKIRVLTPVLARAHKDIRTIPILRGSVTRNTTLKQVKALIANHLCVEVSDTFQGEQECNCSFARQIDERALRNEVRAQGEQDSIPSSTTYFIVVQGKNNVHIMETDGRDKSSLLNQVRDQLGGDIDSKEVAYIGGALEPNTSDRYTKMPVLAVCSKTRHGKSDVEYWNGSSHNTCLDLHTSEAPIEMSALNRNFTIDELCLADLAINGVINIYVVERKVAPIGMETESGKDAIFLDCDAWEHPVTQSNRGMAMLLSSLRVFSELISAKHMEHPSQDAVLHLFNLLTRFPPAVRAVHILMNGKSPRPCERAALSQALYEVLKDVVPLQLIKSDPKRILEGARLLFGLILEKAKHLKLKEDAKMPYISSLKVIDLRNTFTMEPISHPIQTTFGLVEQGYYEAFQEGGILYWKTGEPPLSVLPLDERTKRIALLCGGVVPQITILDLNNLSSAPAYTGKWELDLVISPRELSDLNHLSALCSRNRLPVLPPANLPSADSPALTLDRDGLLAVYVGRAPCAQPGKDITIFRPTNGGEETVDVSIITQLLVPILEQRESEGVTIFDAFGDGIRKFKAPDEILMVVVDCSHSMSENSDFSELKDECDEDGDDSASDIYDGDSEAELNTSVDGSTFFCATLDEMKTSITEHESFADIICIVHDAPSYRRREVAAKILGILSGLASQELSTRLERLEDLKKRFTNAYYRTQSAISESDITRLKTFIAGLNSHKQSLCDFLIYRAANSAVLDEQWTWKMGEDMPKIPKNSSEMSVNLLPVEEFSVPPAFLCPISQDVMDDPVTTCDGFTFERNNIERWFQIRASSPLTGLVLDNIELIFNGEIANQVKTWIGGNELIPSTPRASSFRTRLSSHGQQNLVTVEFFSRLGAFRRQVPVTLSVNSLYKLAFRGMKGRHAHFQLHSKNVFLAPSESPLSSTNIQNKSIVHINVPEETMSTSSNQINQETETTEFEDLSLIKVYDQFDEVLFSYWIPRKTTNTCTSVIFRYWRYQFKNRLYLNTFDVVPWTGMKDQGDGHFVGSPQDHWNQLSGYLNRLHANGSLKNEKLCPKESTEDDDAVTEMADTNTTPPLVLKLYLGRKPAKKSKKLGKYLSRLDVLKSMFDAFVNRLLAYNFQTHMGLITFQSSANVSQSITHVIENFRHKVNNMKAHGDTALWDALALASDQIIDYAKKFPNAKKRIICLSDGNDNMSKQKNSDLSLFLSKNNVVVDSFCLGDEDNVELRTISYLSGGYKFKPESLEQAMAICEMEPVLSQLERPTIVLPAQAHSHLYDPYLRFAFAKDMAIPEVVTADIFPQRKKHPNSEDHFVQLSSMTGNAPGSSSSVNTHSDSNLRTSRILTEIRNILANPHPHYDVYLSESNMSFWKVIMQGPPESAYSTGTFVLYIDMEEDYPAFPPKCRFTTPIYHPNINRHGKVCHSILDRNWTSDTTNLQLINTIYSLLLVPEFSDPINAVVTLNFHWDEVAFRDEAKAHITKHATKPRAEWKAEILGE